MRRKKRTLILEGKNLTSARILEMLEKGGRYVMVTRENSNIDKADYLESFEDKIFSVVNKKKKRFSLAGVLKIQFISHKSVGRRK